MYHNSFQWPESSWIISCLYSCSFYYLVNMLAFTRSFTVSQTGELAQVLKVVSHWLQVFGEQWQWGNLLTLSQLLRGSQLPHEFKRCAILSLEIWTCSENLCNKISIKTHKVIVGISNLSGTLLNFTQASSTHLQRTKSAFWPLCGVLFSDRKHIEQMSRSKNHADNK